MRVMPVIASLALCLITGLPAGAKDRWDARPLTGDERAFVLERLDGYGEEDTAYVIGRIEGSIAKETPAEGIEGYDNDAAMIMAFGASSVRRADLEAIVKDLALDIHEPCPDGYANRNGRCRKNAREGRSAYKLFYNHYYLGCGTRRSGYGICK